ncbi:uncharacterized protein LOC131880348 [Tigriopus californicus]|uniref:uncharacterized protein LOC131880348 n=1 Tax=Tigriopus californicus TaxID=6832 RepID=UPI0027DA2098|nr:uncharacterized protein LOC131880348 [Tigriopus californicus]XP_059082942.1 uncharacterized protein LOC131880348 [Tigriopus californicus]
MFSHSSIVIFGVLSVIQFSATILIDPYLNDIAQAINFEFRRDSYQRSLASEPAVNPITNPTEVRQDSYGPILPVQDQILGDGSNIVETIVLPPANLELEKLNEVETQTGAPMAKIKDMFLAKSLNASGDLDRLKLVKRVLEQKPVMKEGDGIVIVTPTPQLESNPKVTHSVSKSVKIVIGVPSVSESGNMVGSSSKMRSSPPTKVPTILPKTTSKSTTKAPKPPTDPTKVSELPVQTTLSAKRRTSIKTTTSSKKSGHHKLKRKKLLKKTIRRKDGPTESSKFTYFPARPTRSQARSRQNGHTSANRFGDRPTKSFSPSPTIPPRYHETTLPTAPKRLADPTTAQKVSELLVADPYDSYEFTSEDERIQVAKDYEPLIVPDPLPAPPPPSPIPPVPTNAYSSTRFEKHDFPTSTIFSTLPSTKFQPSVRPEPTPVEYLQEQTLANILGISQAFAPLKPTTKEDYPQELQMSQFNRHDLSSHAHFYGDVIEQYDDYHGNEELQNHPKPLDSNRVVKSIKVVSPFRLVDDLDTVIAPEKDFHFEPTLRPPLRPLPKNPNKEKMDSAKPKEERQTIDDQREETVNGPDLRNFPRFPYNELQELDAKAFSHLADQVQQVHKESSGPEFDFDPSNYELTFGSFDAYKTKDRFPELDEGISKFGDVMGFPENNEEDNISAPPPPMPSMRSIPIFQDENLGPKDERSGNFAYNFNDYSDEPFVPDYGDRLDSLDIYNPREFVQTQSFFPQESGIQVPDIKSHNFPGIVRHVSTYSRSIPFPSTHPDVEHVVDFGAASGENGAFGWYSDSPVGRRK